MPKDIITSWDHKKHWKFAGFIATIVIILSIPFSLLVDKSLNNPGNSFDKIYTAQFTGNSKCIDCHKKEFKKWLGSDHDNAMDLANDSTVLGDFNDAIFNYNGVKSTFFRKGDKFFVNTEGSDGELKDFEILYTFGITPLQQYLIEFPGGKLQCLVYAWDTEENKWFHLYPYDTIVHDEWLHWTKQAQNWNGMCASCHSTNLIKGLDPETMIYNTTWSEIDVNCEACHGPGSKHIEWAELPELGRPEYVDNYGLLVNTADLTPRQEVELCARCHSRRLLFDDDDHSYGNMFDHMLPDLLTAEHYYPDGQILDEVYVYGSFVQSKMYDNEVRCSDCHDSHSVKLVKDGNEVCLQCHRAAVYDSYEHHFHKQKGEEGESIKNGYAGKDIEVGEGAECVKCHMPGRYYMVNDYRPDHSIRIPRPDLSIEIGTPNACNHCHHNKTAKWADEYITKWYGKRRIPHYGSILFAGRNMQEGADKDLAELAGDELFPVIVRATALSLLESYPGEESRSAFINALSDEEDWIRHTAVRHFRNISLEDIKEYILPMLYDPVKAVRMDAVMTVSELSPEQLSKEQKNIFHKALTEYQRTMEYSMDFSFAGLNLGNMYTNLGQYDKAEVYYKKAVEVDEDYIPAKINLAMLYNSLGRNNEAISIFNDVVKAHPDYYEAYYSLGLLLVEMKKYDEAVEYIGKAAEYIPDRARIHYNLGLLQHLLKRDNEAEKSLINALAIEPDNFDFLYALADFYISRNELQKAKNQADRIQALYPLNPQGIQLITYLNSNL